ncbi:head-tail connector protein [Brevundimonas aurantiaca]|jgi:hypothetical protein|uniref:head-tail connector protein n=1 Tax=Brevundimonas aurantiaca TaxID=74316 RepID=UPI001D192A04|nr:head-tail connector protein [Brevundimonas aurantiaca]MCC4295849.1 head-tail connector protein [Brevundimonas aurantiaca]
MVALVTLDRAKAHLHIEGEDQDDELTLKVSDASETVIDYLKRPDHGWTDETAPGQVQAAVLLVLGALWSQREGVGQNAEDLDPISPAVVSLLRRMRDPAIA